MDIVIVGLESEITIPDLKEIMTIQEASEKLELTIQVVTRLVTSNTLEGIRVGRMHLISRISMKSYLDKRKDMSKNDPRRKASISVLLDHGIRPVSLQDRIVLHPQNQAS